MKERESKAWEPTHLRERERERKEKEGRGTGIAWHFVSFSVRSQEQEKEDGKEKSEGEGSVSWDCLLVKRGKTLPAKQSLDWSWEGCLGLCPLDTVPRLAALPRSPACLPGWSRIQSPQPPFSYLPPDALFHSSLTPSKILPAFDLLYQLSPGAVADMRMRAR